MPAAAARRSATPTAAASRSRRPSTRAPSGSTAGAEASCKNCVKTPRAREAGPLPIRSCERACFLVCPRQTGWLARRRETPSEVYPPRRRCPSACFVGVWWRRLVLSGLPRRCPADPDRRPHDDPERLEADRDGLPELESLHQAWFGRRAQAAVRLAEFGLAGDDRAERQRPDRQQHPKLGGAQPDDPHADDHGAEPALCGLRRRRDVRGHDPRATGFGHLQLRHRRREQQRALRDADGRRHLHDRAGPEQHLAQREFGGGRRERAADDERQRHRAVGRRDAQSADDRGERVRRRCQSDHQRVGDHLRGPLRDHRSRPDRADDARPVDRQLPGLTGWIQHRQLGDVQRRLRERQQPDPVLQRSGHQSVRPHRAAYRPQRPVPAGAEFADLGDDFGERRRHARHEYVQRRRRLPGERRGFRRADAVLRRHRLRQLAGVRRDRTRLDEQPVQSKLHPHLGHEFRGRGRGLLRYRRIGGRVGLADEPGDVVGRDAAKRRDLQGDALRELARRLRRRVPRAQRDVDQHGLLLDEQHQLHHQRHSPSDALMRAFIRPRSQEATELMTMRAIVVASLLVLAGCGGGGGTTPSTGSGANGGSPSGGGSSSSGSIRFVIPNKGSSGASSSRGPAYVSPSSVSLKVTINSIGGNTSIPSSIPNPQTTNLTTTGTNPPCAINAGVETCTVPIPVPTGSVSYTFDLYDATGATGNHLATATQTLTNVAGTNPPVSVGLSGIVAKVAVTGTPAFQLETAASQQLSIVPEDADDNPITGSALYYSGSLLVTDNDTSGTTGLTLGSASTLPAVGASSVTVTSGANDFIYLNYNGAASSDPNFTVSSKFNGPTTIDGSPVSVSLAAFSQQSNNTYTGGSTVTFPPAGGFSGTLNLGTPVTAASGNVKAVTTAAAPTEGAPLAFMRKAAAAVRHTQSGGTFEVLAYLEVTFANQYIFANQPPTFAVTLPATVVDPTATYYIAFYDPVTSTWNDAYLGPVSASGDTLTFTT